MKLTLLYLWDSSIYLKKGLTSFKAIPPTDPGIQEHSTSVNLRNNLHHSRRNNLRRGRRLASAIASAVASTIAAAIAAAKGRHFLVIVEE